MQISKPKPLGAIAIASLVLLAAGCGGSGKSPPSTNGSTPSQNPVQAAFKYATCMLDHGVANFPDPTTNGGASSAVSTIDKHSPAFQTAARHCSSLVPGEPSLATAPQTHLMERSEAENAQ